MKPLIIISGPTATGKTKTSLQLAQAIPHSQIINFDSLLFYKELNVATAKPTKQERESVPHHLIDILSVKEPMNASLFIKEAKRIIHQLHSQNAIPLLVGGSAFYLRALIKGMYDEPISSKTEFSLEDFSEKEKQEKKNEITSQIEKMKNTELVSFLKTHDPSSNETVHPNDRYRLSRAVEYFKRTGKKISEAKKQITDPYDLSNPIETDWSLFHIYLDIPKDQHWEIIHKRAQEMVKEGMILEIKSLLESGVSETEKPMQSIGPKETINFLRGHLKDEDELIERLFISTSPLAKSQRTFFKKLTPKHEFNPLEDEKKIRQKTEEFLTSLED